MAARAVEWFEYAGAVCLGNARAAVRDRECGHPVFYRNAHGHRLGAMPFGVEDQIADKPRQKLRIAVYHSRPAIDFDLVARRFLAR